MAAKSTHAHGAPRRARSAKGAARSVAVIEVGSTSVRMVVAEISADGSVHPLDFLQQPVGLGRDAFTRGEISRAAIEECVRVLRGYKRVLAEYHVEGEDQVRAVATSAVREATNRVAVVDRIYVATGINVEPIDELDIARLTYLSLYEQIHADRQLLRSPVLIAVMEGGSTDLIYLEKGSVTFTRNYRLGSLRLRKMLETYRTPASHELGLMQDQIRQTVSAICQGLPRKRGLQLLALGGEARFAAAQLAEGWDHESPVGIPSGQYAGLVDEVLSRSVDETVRAYHLSFVEAETLAPALYFYRRLGRSLGVRELLVSGVSARNGILLEMARPGVWVEALRDQIIAPAREVGRKYHVNEAHVEHVASLCGTLFAALADEHKLGPRHELLLTVAALLHDVGRFVSERNHHKHSYYLIQHSELFGLSTRDIQLVALVARYHRRASPKPEHEGFTALGKEGRVIVAKLAAILRVADALDRSYNQRVRDIVCRREDGRFIIEVPHLTDLSPESFALRGKGSMFEDVYGMGVALRPMAGRGK